MRDVGSEVPTVSGSTETQTPATPVIPEGHEIALGVTSRVTYGKYVNYNINLDIGTANDVTDDWKVFYDDGTNIFIIAADYVPTTNIIAEENESWSGPVVRQLSRF